MTEQCCLEQLKHLQERVYTLEVQLFKIKKQNVVESGPHVVETPEKYTCRFCGVMDGSGILPEGFMSDWDVCREKVDLESLPSLLALVEGMDKSRRQVRGGPVPKTRRRPLTKPDLHDWRRA